MKKSIFLALLVCIFLSFMAVGCNKKSSDSSGSSGDLSSNIGVPADYFPTEKGCRWEYEITIGKAEPLQFRITTWPMGDKGVRMATRSRFLPLISSGNPKSSFILAYSIKGPVEKAGPYAWSPVELKIERDDLGIYKDVKNVYLIHAPDYLSMEVVTYSPDSPGAPGGTWGSWGQEDGYSDRIIFFADKPMIARSIIDSDMLLFLGLDGKELHFCRQVSAEEKSEDVLGSAFTEDLWYAKGKGLVKLQQKINGEVSMTWNLKKFSSI